jgi:hypothetical protein
MSSIDLAQGLHLDMPRTYAVLAERGMRSALDIPLYANVGDSGFEL